MGTPGSGNSRELPGIPGVQFFTPGERDLGKQANPPVTVGAADAFCTMGRIWPSRCPTVRGDVVRRHAGQLPALSARRATYLEPRDGGGCATSRSPPFLSSPPPFPILPTPARPSLSPKITEKNYAFTGKQTRIMYVAAFRRHRRGSREVYFWSYYFRGFATRSAVAWFDARDRASLRSTKT